ncbi:hypothetical protein GCM10027598_76110 [Amycolatopsis oliviviridis]|uniref:KAP NTPase domain-containing protein n=1 Tax=Amycolatopsis oliviviridis TaxID=1471590 RepID=A0ABQ3L4J5_9PSEU|nr:hypothetical protein [Amycolatopsis oliviviridis]GHH03848.1 hypothetical protein GCM10017790_06050 [Amycolatopsis oliviviridis]
MTELPRETNQPSVLHDSDAFFDDFETWSTRLALEELLDEALGTDEISYTLKQEELRAEEAREAVLTSASALARVRLERERALRVHRGRPSSWELALQEARVLAVAGFLVVGYFSVLRVTWPAMPPFLRVFGLVGFLCVLVLAAGSIVRRMPVLFVRDKERSSGAVPHPDLVALGDRRDHALREIVLPELHAYIRANRRTYDRTDLVFAEPDSFDPVFGPGLVQTAAVKRLRRIIVRAESVAIALAGSRGAGKTTSIRSLEEGLLSQAGQAAPLVVVASAPAAYEARDFVLHLHALLCKAVLATISPGAPVRVRWWSRLGGLIRRTVWFLVRLGAAAAAVWLLWGEEPRRIFAEIGAFAAEAVNSGLLSQRLWAGMPVGRVLALGVLAIVFVRLTFGLGALLVNAVLGVIARRRNARIGHLKWIAERQLDRIRFLQTYTTGWSGKLSMPLKGEAGRTWSTQRAEQQLTHPEVVDKFREFAELAAECLAEEDVAGRVVIAIDELDKIGEPEKAHQFINDVKGVFDVPGCLFFVSVSDDAVLGFEQRGLGVRDAFDSAFSEMVRLEPFTLDESRLWIALRLRGISEQFCYLAHCLSGGLPRDLKRCAVEMVDLANEVYQPSLEFVTRSLVTGEMAGKIRAFTATAATLERSPELVALTTDLLGVPGTEEAGELAEIAERLVRDDGEIAAPISELRRQSGSFVLFCATVLEVFDDTLTGDRLSPGLHRLAVVRQRMAMHPQQAWDDLVEFRKDLGRWAR